MAAPLSGASSTPPRGRPCDGHLEDKKIACLVVEDDPFQMAAISQLIGKAETAAGLDVSLQFASNAVEAVEASAQNNIDLVLLDFLLPGGRDGATALPEIRENIGKASSIIMISGSAQEAPMRACRGGSARIRIQYSVPRRIRAHCSARLRCTGQRAMRLFLGLGR